ncbi:YicC/YloC family endoribonuclease [Rohdeia mirabilis]
MTGFGAATAEHATVRVTVEARSVNHRFLQVKVRLPHDMGALEADVENLVKQRLGRGSVNLSVRVEPVGGAATVRVDEDVVARYREQLEQLAATAGVPFTLSLAEWAHLPGVLETRSTEFDPRATKAALMEATAGALDGLVEMRDREGLAMADDLARNAAELKATVALIAERAPDVVKRLQDELRRRVALLVDRPTIEADELAREVASIADRADIAEELSRLEAHLGALGDLLGSGTDAVGRKLDFLVQELFREVNTVGSKSADAQIAHWVVDAKTAIERLREQVQNVE